MSGVSRWRRIAATVVGVLLLATAGCAQVVPGEPTPAYEPSMAAPSAAPVAPDDVEQLSLGTADALQSFWRTAFPAAFGKPWTDITVLMPVHTADPDVTAPPCTRSASDVDGQAFYCPAADSVVWDADGLLPELNRDYGAAGIVVVLAHEIGHAVQNRLGVDAQVRSDPDRHPTILLEAMADCYAGVALAHFADHPVAGLQIGPQERDAALLAMISFRDPLGVQPGDDMAHGNAFDRVSAFQDGYTSGATECAGMTVENRAFTQRMFGSADDAARKGDLPLAELVPAVETDARAWFGSLAAGTATGWAAPALRTTASGACQPAQLQAQGPVAFCPVDGSVTIDPAGVAPVHRRVGDYAVGALIASRYGLALLAASGVDPASPAAGDAALCLAGAYTGRLFGDTSSFSLSPGDLDEAVQVLVLDSWAARDAKGDADPAEHGFERIERFRTGAQGGPQACVT